MIRTANAKHILFVTPYYAYLVQNRVY